MLVAGRSTRGEGSKRTVAERSLIVLGDEGCGKTHLVARLKQVDYDAVTRCLAMDSTYIDIIDEDEEDYTPVGLLNVWQLAGDEHYAPLLKVAVANASQVMFLVCLNFAKPWTMLDSLRTWLRVIETTLAAAEYQPGQLDDMKQKMVNMFRSYREPGAGAAAAASESTTGEAGAANAAGADSLLPLTEGALVRNLGVPIVVALTMCDRVESLQSQYAYKDAHFDYMYSVLRKVCLEYGAALVCTSAKENVNTEALMAYLRHLGFGMRCTLVPETVEKDRVVIPAGWDAATKISALDESARVLIKGKAGADGAEPAFADVIKAPLHLLGMAGKSEPAVTAEDDQDFLQRFKEYVEQDPDAAGAADAGLGKGLTDLLAAGKKKPGPGSTPAASASTIGTPSVLQALGVQAPATGTPAAGQQKEEALSSFFASLMTKNAAGATPPADAKPAP